MIRHNPPGRGHRYRDSLDQRIPFQPTAGDGVELRVLADPGLSSLVVEVARHDRVAQHPMTRLGGEASPSGSSGAADGHLAAAAEAGEDAGGLTAWTVRVGPFEAGEVVRYRFVNLTTDEATRWWSFVPATWSDVGGDLEVLGSPVDRIVSGSVSWLTAELSADHDPAGAVTGPLRARFALRLAENEHVVGLGERYHALDQRGWAVDAEVFEQYCAQGERTYLPVPFAHVVGGEGWGFHVDTTRRVWFDVGATDGDLLWIEVAVAPDDPDVTLRLWSGAPATVLAGFLEHVGTPGLIPDWAYRPWISGNEWNTQARVEAEVGRSLAEGIPVGVVVIEAWSDEGTIHIFRDAQYEPTLDGASHRLADFTFPADGAWPDPVGMVERFHAQGVRVLLWQIPVIPDHDIDADVPQLIADRAALIGRGLAVLEEDGAPYRNRGWWFPGALLPDFTTAEGRRWWTEKRRYLLEEVGIDGFKTDGGEHAWGNELRFADGTRGDVSNNRYPNLYAQAFHELIRSTGADALTFSRAGHAGAGSFPAHWAGDEKSTWDAYRASVIAGLTAGASGVFSWGWDHGGFSGDIPDAELYLRTAAMACVCPIMQYHAEYNHHRTPANDRTPWNIADRTRSPEVLTTYRRFAVLRDRLVGYLAEEARKAVAASKPLMRPLFFEWPDDEHIWQHPMQYMLGDDLLVAPVVEPGAAQWAVYLPAGEWVDVWSGERHVGRRLVTVDAPLQQIPVFAREAAAPRHVVSFAGLPG